MNADEAVLDGDTSADETNDADAEQETSQEPRHRPTEKRSEGRRRRRRGPRPSADAVAETEATPTEGVQSASAAELASVDASTNTEDTDTLFATIPSAQTAETESSVSEDAPTQVAEASDSEQVQREVDSTSIDTSGITADGRAINDPRVDARPIGDVAVKTAIGSVFGTEAFPDAPHFASEAPRAANDPRGPIIDEPAANDELIEENEVAGA
jgi:ribonuclease E